MRKEISHFCNKKNEGYWVPQKGSKLLKADTQEAEQYALRVCMYVAGRGTPSRARNWALV